MRITIVPEISQKLGIDISSVSILYDPQADCLTVYGLITGGDNTRKHDRDTEPDVLATFHNAEGNTLFAVTSEHYIPYSINGYSLFKIVIGAVNKQFDLSEAEELRLRPYFHTV